MASKIVVSTNVNDYITVKRSWKERFFSLPWQPWIETKVVYSPVEYIISGKRMVVSPETYKRMQNGQI